MCMCMCMCVYKCITIDIIFREDYSLVLDMQCDCTDVDPLFSDEELHFSCGGIYIVLWTCIVCVGVSFSEFVKNVCVTNQQAHVLRIFFTVCNNK